MNLRLRKGTVQVRGRTEDRSQHWHLPLLAEVSRTSTFGGAGRGGLLGRRSPRDARRSGGPGPGPCPPARSARPRGLPALRRARRAGYPHPLPARVSFGWFKWRKSNPRGSTRESLDVLAPSSGGTAGGGSGAARAGRAGRRGWPPPPRGARRGNPASCSRFLSPPGAGGCPLSARCRSPFSLLAF